MRGRPSAPSSSPQTPSAPESSAAAASSPARPPLPGTGTWARRVRSPWWWTAGGILLLALTVRLAVVGFGLAPVDADVATTGLMARGISHGETFLFFAGQRYMGAAEQYASALAVLVLGENRWSRTIVGILLAVVATGQVMVLARRWARPDRARVTAIAAGLAFALGPFASVLWSVWPRGAHLAAMVTTLAVLDLATRRRLTVLGALAQGLLTAFGLWLSLATLLVSGPALWWLLGRLVSEARATAAEQQAGSGADPSSGRDGAGLADGPYADVVTKVIALLAGAVVGAAPIAYAYLVKGTGVDWLVGAADPTVAYTERLQRVFLHTLPQALGAEAPNVLSWWNRKLTPTVPGVPGSVFGIAAYAAVVVVAARRWRALLATATLRTKAARPTDLLVGLLLLTPFLQAASRMAWMYEEPRYLVNQFPLMVIAAALAATAPRRPRAVLAGFAAVVVLSAGSTVRWVATEVALRQQPGKISAEQAWTILADSAERAGVKHVAGDYWFAFPLNLYGHGRFDVREMHTQQFVSARAKPNAPGPWGFIDSEKRVTQWRAWWTQRGHTFREVHVKGIVLFVDFKPGLTPAEIKEALPVKGFPFPT